MYMEFYYFYNFVLLHPFTHLMARKGQDIFTFEAWVGSWWRQNVLYMPAPVVFFGVMSVMYSYDIMGS